MPVQENLPTIEWQAQAGTLTILPSRGRVLQVRVAGHEAYWVNDCWDGGWNVGGDRVWIGPENDWFWQTSGPIDFSKYQIPEAVDPGHWRLDCEHAARCGLAQSGRLAAAVKNAGIDFQLRRDIALIDPIAPFFAASVAYRTVTTIRVAGPSEPDTDAGCADGLAADIWSITQIPAGGSLIVGTSKAPAWREYFGSLPDDLRRIESNALVLNLTGQDMFKIGIAPDTAAGWMAYVRQVPDGRLVILRRFWPQPLLRYVDMPLTDRTRGGDCVQVYNDGGDLGAFGEMEYHSPALLGSNGNRELVETSDCIVGIVELHQWEKWCAHWL